MSQHLLAIRHLEAADITELLNVATAFKEAVTNREPLKGIEPKVIGLLLFENSTRTRVSFEQAASYLGYRMVNFSGTGSSMSKGETLKDTILTLRYERLEGLVIRHRSSGGATLAAKYFGGPVVNAGDGQHEHPTQALGDALTILERKGDIQGLTVAIVGDVLHSRVARSNAWLLHKLGADVRFVGPRTLIPSHTGKLPGSVFYDLPSGLAGADVVMCLRLQKERMTDGLLSSVGEYRRLYQINRQTLRYADSEAIVLHPGPLNRGIEVDDSVADSDISCVNDQVSNGIFVKMAVLTWMYQDPRPSANGEGPE